MIKALDSLSQVRSEFSTVNLKDQWNSLNKLNNPFVSFEFFEALEKGQCVKGNSGWYPLYFTKWDNQKLLAALVAFVKTDSYGEFIFDWDWARAYQQYGLNYYPKLTLAIPFSPISAPKLLGDLDIHKNEILPALQDFFQKEDLSGVHALFTTQEEDALFQSLPSTWTHRDSFQYHWKNEGYQTFDDFLDTLKKNKRKNIKKERRIIKERNLSYHWLKGSEVSPEDINFFYQSYLGTIDKKWSQAYLTKEFFAELFRNLPNNTHLLLAKQEDTRVACALYLTSDTTLFGRYWGCAREIEYLHFELCIYQGIEFCLRNNLGVFEAGAQGEHKRLRGFRPTWTSSWHQLKREDFNTAIKKFCYQESQSLKSLFSEFDSVSPFKNQ